MNREELKLFIKSTNISKLVNDNNIKPYIIASTSYLINSNLSERIYHIVNDLYEIPICTVCQKNPSKFGRIEIRKNGKRISEYKGYMPCSKKCSDDNRKQRIKLSQTNDVRNKIRNTNIKKYGKSTNLQTDDNKLKLKEKYGDIMFKSDYFKEKSKATNIKKYGVDHYFKSDLAKNTIKSSFEKARITRIGNNIKLLSSKLGDDYCVIDYNNKAYKIKHIVCGTEFEINNKIAIPRVNSIREICIKCNPINSLNSSYEQSICRILDDLNINYIRNDRNIIKPFEIDIYIPDYKIAIEFNGLYWHSEIYKDKFYHYNKYLKCKENDIRLIQIYENEFINRNQQINNFISSIFKYDKLFARKCEIKEINSVIEKEFIDLYHIQGYSPSSICYGLYYGDELYQIMSFKKQNDKIEIQRLCTRFGYKIVGGSERLFKHFIKNNKSKIIFSYCSIDKFDGITYQKLGMKLVKHTEPNYFYFKGYNILSRQQCMKHKLIAMGFDKNMIESDIMKQRGYLKIYNSGNFLYEYRF